MFNADNAGCVANRLPQLAAGFRAHASVQLQPVTGRGVTVVFARSPDGLALFAAGHRIRKPGLEVIGDHGDQ